MNLTTLNRPASPFPPEAAGDELTSKFQRMATELVHAGMLSASSAKRMMGLLERDRACAQDLHQALQLLVQRILLSIADGTLRDGEHIRRLDRENVAVHPRLTAQALYAAQRGQLTAREIKSLFRFGGAHCDAVIPVGSMRVMFGAEGDRRRAAILHLPSAYEFVGRPGSSR